MTDTGLLRRGTTRYGSVCVVRHTRLIVEYAGIILFTVFFRVAGKNMWGCSSSTYFVPALCDREFLYILEPREDPNKDQELLLL